jgi:NDP-sugar pyrophosphorylase family protein
MKSVEDMQVVILAGGLGTRLRPYTETIPKSMMDICGKPFLEYQLNHIRNSGMKKVLLCVGYLGEKIEEYFKNGKDFGLDIKYSYEEKQLGTAGALKNAEFLIETNPFVVINGDTYSDFKFKELKNNYPFSNPLITMVVTNATNPKEQELVELKGDNVSNFYQRETIEHRKYLVRTSNPLINSGIYAFNSEILIMIPEGKICSLEKEIFPPLLGEIKGIVHNGYMKDIGNINLCKELEQDILEGKIK